MGNKPQILLFESYLQFVKNSIGSNQYRNLFAEINGEYVDILRDGELSCAVFASSVVYQFQLIDRPHATVDGSVAALEAHGWHKIKKERAGCILIWEEKEFESESHKHMGFFVGEGRAISNSAIEKTPTMHDWKFMGSKFGEREIVAIYWHSALESPGS